MQVVFFNSRADSKGVALAAKQAQVQHLKVTHVRGDPLSQTDMGEKLNIASCAPICRHHIFSHVHAPKQRDKVLLSQAQVEKSSREQRAFW